MALALYLCSGPITSQLGLRDVWIECFLHPVLWNKGIHPYFIRISSVTILYGVLTEVHSGRHTQPVEQGIHTASVIALIKTGEKHCHQVKYIYYIKYPMNRT